MSVCATSRSYTPTAGNKAVASSFPERKVHSVEVTRHVCFRTWREWLGRQLSEMSRADRRMDLPTQAAQGPGNFARFRSKRQTELSLQSAYSAAPQPPASVGSVLDSTTSVFVRAFIIYLFTGCSVVLRVTTNHMMRETQIKPQTLVQGGRSSWPPALPGSCRARGTLR